MIREAIRLLREHKDLAADNMRLAMEEIMSGNAHTPEIVSFLTLLSAKKETVEEVTAAVQVLRKHVTKVSCKQKVILDTCGTGADKRGTFNISTAVAFVASGAGATVAKHGNRSVSSSSGSADILEALGININQTAQKIEKCLNEIGIAFLFAQNLHQAMRHAAEARKQIGSRTIFNILGPLANPACATHQLVGVYDRRLSQIIAGVLGNLGVEHALVVHGEDGLDELTTTAKTFIYEEKGGKIKDYEVAPEDFGFKRVGLEDLAGGSAQDNAKMLLDVLNGKLGPKRDIVLLNSAAALYAADKTGSIKEGIGLAAEAIDSGKAIKKLELLKEYSLN